MTGSATLVIRLSAMGDVALALPVVRRAVAGRKVVVVTRSLFAKFFYNIPGISIVEVDTRGRHKGLLGIFRLFQDIRNLYKIDCVVDLHNVIRSRILSLLFRLTGCQTSKIDKGRSEKRKFIEYPSSQWLTHTTDRYIEAFKKVGLDINDLLLPAFNFSNDEQTASERYFSELSLDNSVLKVGIAPFARHKTKQWQLDKVAELILLIKASHNSEFFLFGGPDEIDLLKQISDGFDYIHVVNERSGIREEISIISRLDLMVSMDSSNMHLASIAGVRTASIWGGTHPGVGFSPVGTQQHLQIQISEEDLDCRPCTIYGKGGCKRDDQEYKCLIDISAGMVFEKMNEKGFLQAIV